MAQSDSLDQGTDDSQSSGSGTSNQKGGSQPEYITVEQLKQLLAEDRETQRRQAQSEKDKGLKQLNQRVEGMETNLKAILQTAAASGKSAKDVIDEVNSAEEAFNRQVIAEMAQAWKSGQFVPASQGSGEKNEVDVDGVIEEFGLDTEDLRVAAFKTRRFETIEAAEIAAAKLVKLINSNQSASESTRPPREDATPPRPSAKLDRLQAEYDEKAKTTRGQALINLKMEYRKKGLPVS